MIPDARGSYRAGLMSGLMLAGVAVVGLAAIGSRTGHVQSAIVASTPGAARDDVARVTAMLAGVRGAVPLTCEMTARNLRGNFWDRGMEPIAAPEVRALANWAGRDIEDPAVVPILRSAMGDADRCVRRIAARLLGRTAAPTAPLALLEALGSPDSTMREMAALGLGVSEPREALEPLIGVLRNDPARSVRLMAAWALGEMEDVRAIDPLLQVLDDADPNMRRAAAVSLGEIESRQAVAGLVRALDDDEPAVRLDVIWALGQIEDPVSAAPLGRVLLGDADPEVRAAAAEALGDILG